MTNKSIDPLFISALDILTGALGVFIIMNFLNTRLAGTAAPAPQTPIAAKAEKPATRPATPRAQPHGVQRPASEYRPGPPPQPALAPVVQPKPEPPKPAPVEQQPPSPPQDPVAVDLMRQTKGAVTLLLQQDGVAKQSVEFMLRQGSKTWKPSRASKYQNEAFRYEKSLNYYYQADAQPGVYEVWVRVKRGNRNAGNQPFALFGKIIPPGQKSVTHQFGTYAVGSSDDWVRAGTFTVTANSLNFKSSLPAATATKPAEPPPASAPPAVPKTEPKKTGKWG